MKSFNFLYVAMFAILFLGFVSLLDNGRAEAGHGLFNSAEEILLHQWVVTEATDKESNRDLSGEFNGLSWQFLKDGAFVVFRDQVIDRTGEWKLKDQVLLVQYDTSEVQERFKIHRLDRTEMLLIAGNTQLKLLKLDD